MASTVTTPIGSGPGTARLAATSLPRTPAPGVGIDAEGPEARSASGVAPAGGPPGTETTGMLSGRAKPLPAGITTVTLPRGSAAVTFRGQFGMMFSVTVDPPV